MVRTPEGYRIGPDGGVYFYGGPLSNFDLSPITVEGELWPTVEHYFQAQRAADAADRNAIREARHPRDAKRLSHRVEQRSDWEEVKFRVMLNGIRAKFGQHEKLRDILLSTSDRPIFEDSPTDHVWGYRDGGLNLLGKALMQIRAELRDAYIGTDR